MPQQCNCHKLSVTNFVNNDTTDDDTKAKSRKASSIERSKLRGIEPKFFAPIVENSSTDCETNASSKDCHETSPKQPMRIWNRRVA
jgi:hypothetical protein